jgi:glucuronosyltransferase
MKFVALLAFVFLISCDNAVASRILFVYPMPSKSHLIVVQGLSKTLAQKGHEVTVISPFPLDKKLKNYRDVEIPMREEANDLMRNMVQNPNQNKFATFPSFIRMMTNMNTDLMNLPEFKKIMKEEKFDLVVIGMFFNDFLLGLSDHFKCPSMMLSPNTAFTATNILMGNPLGVSSVPHMMAPVSGRMSFLNRAISFMLTGVDLAMYTFMDYRQKNIYE